MKFIITFLLIVGISLIANAEDFIEGGIYVKAAEATQKATWTSQATNETVLLKIGKTYSSSNKSLDLFSQDKEITLQLSSGLLVQISPKSEFRVDSFNQMIADADNEPEALKIGDYILNVSLMNGSAYFVAPKYTSPNTMCILQTPLMNLELNGGKYHIKTSQKYTFIYVLEGSIGIFDNQTNEKTTEFAGEMVLIFPNPTKTTDTLITRKSISTEDIPKLSATLQKMESATPKVSFVVISGKIVGVKLQ